MLRNYQSLSVHPSPEDCIYGIEPYEERINSHVLAQLADFSELSSDNILDALEKTGFFEENFLLDIKRLNVNLEGSPYW